MTVVLALDVGTSTVKAAVVADGRVEEVAEHPLALSHPGDGQVEQHPDDWWAAVVESVQRLGTVRSRRVDVIALTGQMQDLIPLDRNGVAVRPAMLYADTRAVAEHAALVDSLGTAWAQVVGALPDATNVAAKWRWLARVEPGATARTHRIVVGAHGAVARRLTGRAATDPTTAATTGLYDLHQGTWWVPVCTAGAPEVPPLPVPDIVSPTEVMGTCGADAARMLGVEPGTPVVLASGDAVATTLGVVGERFDTPYAYVGTSGWVAVATPAPRPGDGVIVLPGLGTDHWVSAGPLLAAGAVLDWARSSLLGGIDHQHLDRLAAGVCAAAEGVLLWPHLDGVRTPEPDPHATGVLLGARRSTSSAVVAAAALEGVAHALRAIADTVAPHTSDLAVCGGASRSDLLAQVLADVTGRTVHRVADEHAAVRGAAACAHRAVGAAPIAPAERLATFAPRPEQRRAHERLAPAYDALPGALASIFSSLADVRAPRRPSTSASADDHEGETSP